MLLFLYPLEEHAGYQEVKSGTSRTNGSTAIHEQTESVEQEIAAIKGAVPPVRE